MISETHLITKRDSAGSDPVAAQALLAWYDHHRRDLPWRAIAGESQAPYRVWLSEIMLQQTTVEAVKPYFARFLTLWPHVEALAKAEDQALFSAWAGLGYYARARNLLACARQVVADYGGIFPADEACLRALPGIGDYTAAAIRAIAFNQPALVVDGNVERVITRLFAIKTPLPKAKSEIKAALAPLASHLRPGDFAQAMMDLGATICTPRKPACVLCPWQGDCVAAREGRATDFPVKLAKKPKPVRYGAAFVALNPLGQILVRSRPEKGLLARMSEVPGSEWRENEPGYDGKDGAPFDALWLRMETPIIHVFTHFELRLWVYHAQMSRDVLVPQGCRWVGGNALIQEPLPTLFRKVIDLAG
jgi:A/G-specific adenine glycosylase